MTSSRKYFAVHAFAAFSTGMTLAVGLNTETAVSVMQRFVADSREVGEDFRKSGEWIRRFDPGHLFKEGEETAWAVLALPTLPLSAVAAGLEEALLLMRRSGS
ncbi:hypothetical protein [Roseibium aestuarii]|uniref:Uncharacterized protein n=1 Tax=Roseibium aestuarii TaxID=2600299 RepID=A0ABW4JTW5_9HYPH|nr:hypothetical protein [Roseibium aestuarii]